MKPLYIRTENVCCRCFEHVEPGGLDESGRCFNREECDAYEQRLRDSFPEDFEKDYA